MSVLSPSAPEFVPPPQAPPPPPPRPHTCRNCGLVGHLYKDCPHPVMSFGLLCHREARGGAPGLEYLMIQRRDSLSFMELIRGKFQVEDTRYVASLLSQMTHAERRALTERGFNDLWNQVWYQAFIPRQTQEYHEARAKFEALHASGALTTLLRATRTEHAEPEWGFPKGRRRLREADVDAAVREFCEETGFAREDVVLLPDVPPYEEIFYGTNRVLYRHVYYAARLCRHEDRPIVVNPANLNQAREVRQARWFAADDVLQRIRPHNRERRALFADAHRALMLRRLRPGSPPAPALVPAPRLYVDSNVGRYAVAVAVPYAVAGAAPAALCGA